MPIKILDYESWLGKWPLQPFMEKLDELKPQELKGTKRYVLVLMEFRVLISDILSFFRYIGAILKRLNDNTLKCLEPDLTPKRGKEFPFGVISLMNIDLISFVLFARILMDKISPLLSKIVVGGDKPSKNRFNDWRKKIDKYEGNGLEELKKIICNANWFDELKNLRDDYVVHHGLFFHNIVFADSKLGFQLRSQLKKEEVFLSIEKVKEVSQNIFQFLEELNKFLCDKIDLLPIEINKIE